MKEVYMNMNPNEIESEYLNGVYNEIANTLGIEAAITIYSTYRGQQITFPVNFSQQNLSHQELLPNTTVKTFVNLLQNMATVKNGLEKWLKNTKTKRGEIQLYISKKQTKN